jgi:type VI secretion system protein VasG
MIGAGGQAGQNDAANLLKPALARGELRTVAATTWSEYKKYFEKDAALARRFQVVKVEEPSEPLAAAMLRGMAPLMEKHFNVRLFDEAITEAVRLSARYISGRQLPDKAISVLDTACAKVALGQNATPSIIEDTQRQLERLGAEREALLREQAAGADHAVRLGELNDLRQQLTDQAGVLKSRWEREKALVAEIREMRSHLESAPTEAAAGEPKPKAKSAKPAKASTPEQAALQAKLAELEQLQGESPMVPMQVDGTVVAEIVAAWTGIPLGKMVKDEIKTVLGLLPTLKERIIGQDHALEAVAQRVRTARANLEDPNKPKGVFMFVGPSGVGKTETALALADVLYGGERNMITINMSEYQESHTVSGLKGSPPGYVGYGEGGVLTEAVRRRPYSVVLLDEVEKAHPDVHELFFQVFDKGWMEDGEGRLIDFKNTIILLTSNAGSDLIMNLCKDPELMPGPDAIAKALREPLLKVFPAALLGRIVTIPYYPLSEDMMGRIVKLQLNRIKKRVEANHDVPFTFNDEVVKLVVSRCNEVESGGRVIDALLTNTVLPRISHEYLTRLATGTPLAKVELTVADGDFAYAFD